MLYRIHGPKRRGDSSGKWQRLPHSGVSTALIESEGPWEIRVTHRRSGSTIRRDVYNVAIRCQETCHEETLSGFKSKAAAAAAARKRIALLESLRKRQAIRRSVKGQSRTR